jgi:hypothetical protein
VNRAASQVSLNSSRLVRFLGGLGAANPQVSSEQFALRLGELIDLSDSVRLSATHASLGDTAAAESEESAQTSRGDFLRVRTFMVEAVIRSFSPVTGTGGIKLPKEARPCEPGDQELLAAYLRFYVSHQREMGFKIRNLHTRTREAVAGHSPELAQLCALDAAIGNAISGHTRRYFVVIPKLLGKRFELLLEDYRQAVSAGDSDNDKLWAQTLERFQGEMRELLLAEIEARLLPVVGLIEALDENRD